MHCLKAKSQQKIHNQKELFLSKDNFLSHSYPQRQLLFVVITCRSDVPKSPVTSGIHCARHCAKYRNAVVSLLRRLPPKGDSRDEGKPSHEVLSIARSIPWGEEEFLHLSNIALSTPLPCGWRVSVVASFPEEEEVRIFGSVSEGATPSLPLPRFCAPTAGWRAQGDLWRWQKKVFSIISVSFSQFWSPQTADTLQSHRAAIS